MESKQLQVEYEATDSLIPYANNANIHSDEQIEQIMASIKEFGFNDPIGVWTNAEGKTEIVEGHGRVMAAKKLGIDKLPVIHLDSLTDEQRRAYTHVHNQQTRNSKFDWEILDMEMAELDFEFEELGFDPINIADAINYEGKVFEEDDEIKEYSDRAEDEYLKSYNVIIACFSEEDQLMLKKKLGIPEEERLKRLYTVEELF